MSHSNPRDLIAHGVIVSSLVFGGAYMLLAPRLAERAEREAQLSAAQEAEDAIAQEAQLRQRASAVVEQLNRLEGSIEERSSQSSDELALHRAYHDAADQLGLSIERFDPSPIQQSSTRRRSKQKEEDILQAEFASAVRIDATGTLDAAVEFVEFVSRSAGFVRIKSLRITPNDEVVASGIRLSLETEHYSFAVPDPASMASVDQDEEGI